MRARNSRTFSLCVHSFFGINLSVFFDIPPLQKLFEFPLPRNHRKSQKTLLAVGSHRILSIALGPSTFTNLSRIACSGCRAKSTCWNAMMPLVAFSRLTRQRQKISPRPIWDLHLCPSGSQERRQRLKSPALRNLLMRTSELRLWSTAGQAVSCLRLFGWLHLTCSRF